MKSKIAIWKATQTPGQGEVFLFDVQPFYNWRFDGNDIMTHQWLPNTTDETELFLLIEFKKDTIHYTVTTILLDKLNSPDMTRPIYTQKITPFGHPEQTVTLILLCRP